MRGLYNHFVCAEAARASGELYLDSNEDQESTIDSDGQVALRLAGLSSEIQPHVFGSDVGSWFHPIDTNVWFAESFEDVGIEIAVGTVISLAAASFYLLSSFRFC